jgi:uncharacterized protein
MSPALADLPRTKTIRLTTYRKDGTAVATPVSLAFANGHAYFRTWDTSGKAKRLRRSAAVEVAPSDVRGKAAGPAVRANAHLLRGADAEQAKHALGRRHPILHGALVPLLHRLMRYRTIFFELIPSS